MRSLLILSAILSAAALAQPAPLRQFIYRLEPVRKDFTLQNITEAERPIVMEHAAYLKSLTEAGKLTVAGQAFDPAGFWGFVVITAPDAETASAMFNADPAVKSRMFRGAVVPFRLVFYRPPEPGAAPNR